MNMKKLLTWIFLCALVAVMLTACAPKHTHAPAESWELNANGNITSVLRYEYEYDVDGISC